MNQLIWKHLTVSCLPVLLTLCLQQQSSASLLLKKLWGKTLSQKNRAEAKFSRCNGRSRGLFFSSFSFFKLLQCVLISWSCLFTLHVCPAPLVLRLVSEWWVSQCTSYSSWKGENLVNESTNACSYCLV